MLIQLKLLKTNATYIEIINTDLIEIEEKITLQNF
jgi:hypothetical protein